MHSLSRGGGEGNQNIRQNSRGQPTKKHSLRRISLSPNISAKLKIKWYFTLWDAGRRYQCIRWAKGNSRTGYALSERGVSNLQARFKEMGVTKEPDGWLCRSAFLIFLPSKSARLHFSLSTNKPGMLGGVPKSFRQVPADD